MNTICIPLHPDGGKYKDNSELRYALRSIERNFVGEFEIAIVAKKLPDWIQGVRHIHGDGLKSSLRSAAKELPDGFFWWYDDNCLLLPTDAETMKRTPAAGGWSKPVTDWRKQLEKVRARLVEEGLPALDYSSPHGPYWFDLSMIEEAFADWPGMSGKFPVESWILSKRNWQSTKGETRQYYGAFKKPPGTGHRYLNYNDTGNTEALRRFLEGIFHMQSRFEKPDPEFTYTGRVRGVVIGMKHRPRWETQCIESMTAAGIDVEVFHGTDMHMGDVPAMPVNAKLFAKEFKRQPLAGEIGCYSSHVRVCKEFQNLPALSEQRQGWRLVFEDDALPVNITAASLDAIVAIAEAGGYDLVLLNTGKKNRRGNRGMSISPSRRKDPFTHAYVLNEKAAKEISGWTMRHPIDLAISKSNKLKIGLLGGKFRFDQRPPRESTESIHRERAGETPTSPNEMHSSVLEFIKTTATAERICGKRVLEVGSYNVNGSAKDIVSVVGPSQYFGVDMQEQAGYVDEVVNATNLIDRFGPESWDVVISTEMLEHAADWKSSVENMLGVLKPGGLLIITARGPGFPLHGYPSDHWRFTTDDVAAMFQDLVSIYLANDPKAPGFLYAGYKRPITLEANPQPMLVPYHSKEAFSERMVSRKTNPIPPKELAAFYHVAAMGNWQDVVTEQCEMLAGKGIIPKCYLLGEKADEDWLARMPVEIIGRSTSLTLYETPTLSALWDWCKTHEDSAVLYFHTKGVSKPEDSNVEPWRKLMELHLIKRVEENMPCLAVADIVGVNWQEKRERPHFSGNFWMARADWVNSLPDPWDHRKAGGPVLGGNTWARMHAEMWIGCRNYHHIESLCCMNKNLWSGPEVHRLLLESASNLTSPA